MPTNRRRTAVAYLRRSSSGPGFDVRRQLECIIAEAAKDGVVLDAKIEYLAHMEQAGLSRFRGIVLEGGFRPGKGPHRMRQC
jgi:hypothetical protein